jgi:hypothetical protein
VEIKTAEGVANAFAEVHNQKVRRHQKGLGRIPENEGRKIRRRRAEAQAAQADPAEGADPRKVSGCPRGKRRSYQNGKA